MLRPLYDKVIVLSASRHALPALATVSFAESSFFPVPPDVLLVPMALARPERARLTPSSAPLPLSLVDSRDMPLALYCTTRSGNG